MRGKTMIDAGYMNNYGKYVENLTYFSFEPNEAEKRAILEQDYYEELANEQRKYNEYRTYREPYEQYENIDDNAA